MYRTYTIATLNNYLSTVEYTVIIKNYMNLLEFITVFLIENHLNGLISDVHVFSQ